MQLIDNQKIVGGIRIPMNDIGKCKKKYSGFKTLTPILKNLKQLRFR